jgi:hypothetical protein
VHDGNFFLVIKTLTLPLPLPLCSIYQNKNEEINANRQGMKSLINNSAVDPIILSLKYLEMCTNNFTSKVLGEGAFGKVYLGYDKALGIQFAVKRISLQIPDQKALNEITLSFNREIAVSLISLANIITPLIKLYSNFSCSVVGT